MVQFLHLCRRRPELDHDEYAEHVLGRHVPLALEHLRGLRDYRVNLVERASPEHPEVDGIHTLAWESEQAWEERFARPDSEKLLDEDHARFLGVVYGYGVRASVHCDRSAAAGDGRRTPGLKWICCVRRHLDLTREAFLSAWLGDHAELVLRHQPAVSRFVSHVVERNLFGRGDDWDLVYELHFDPEKLGRGAFFDAPAGEQAVRESAAALIHRRVTFVVAEHVARRGDLPPAPRSPAA